MDIQLPVQNGRRPDYTACDPTWFQQPTGVLAKPKARAEAKGAS